MRYQTRAQAEGKEPPSLGSGGPSPAAVKAGRENGKDENDMENEALSLVKREQFEQLPRESSKAFAAFRTYLELGPERSLSKAAGKVGKSKVMMERWSRRYDWPGRVKHH